MPLRQSWEDMAVDIWGPRTGKTTARAIPAVLDAPGPTIVTSVKGDIVDATREIRAARGRVWVFDPQDILGAGRSMWWNPLGQIRTITDARRLAEHFAAAEREVGVSRDAFFDPSSEELTANLLLAAAVDGRDILAAYRWAVNPRDDEPALLLRKHGFPLPADSVSAVLNMPDRTRGGIFAGTQKMLMCLTEPSVTQWVTSPSHSRALEFDPAAFVVSTDVLYLLSQGGPGSPAPLVAALTHAVLYAGELRARASAGRRLDPPLLGVLDEAANICRLRQLPNLYSYYGSHGLSLITIFQSYAQGVDVWGREGMRKLWSAANVRTYGGGAADPEWLEELSKLIGEHDVTERATTRSTGRSTGPGHYPLASGWNNHHSQSRSTRRQRILDVSDLHALPRGRMVVFASGAPPVLARTAPWQTGPYADGIRASIARWDPAGRTNWALPADSSPTGVDFHDQP
jgi:type IV secretory pathway TraG/TraD family ATPase VirD4